ncbi:MAG: hypothetical protein AAFV25_28275, partial [Bacteroidota bacterium]
HVVVAFLGWTFGNDFDPLFIPKSPNFPINHVYALNVKAYYYSLAYEEWSANDAWSLLASHFHCSASLCLCVQTFWSRGCSLVDMIYKFIIFFKNRKRMSYLE